MKKVCANFCRNHTYALSKLKEKQRKDVKVADIFLVSQDPLDGSGNRQSDPESL